MEEQHTYMDLFTLQSRLKAGVEGLFPEAVWVRAEVSAMKVRSTGHCYLELSQSGDGGLVAKANAIVWNSRWRFLAPYFREEAGVPLGEGMQVLVRVQVNYSQLYGFSLIVQDIDPSFTVGARELERQRTLDRLQAEGLMDLQKELALPVLPYRLAVISAEGAAGYRDFMRHLHENEYGFVFHTDLFEAVMQGTQAPASIIAAMQAALQSGQSYDALLLLRGGGAKLDLDCYDDYSLAVAIATCPVPVLTAVGHDQDYHVCDRVAHAYLKTPTALADELLDYYAAEDERISSFSTRLRLAFLGKVSALESALSVLESRIAGADPRRILERGYALVLDGSGVALKRAGGVRPGDRVRVLFPDGALDCSVESVLPQVEKRNEA